VAGAVNVVVAAVTVGEANAEFLSAVTLCRAPSVLTNVTVAPGETVIGGPKSKLFAVIVVAGFARAADEEGGPSVVAGAATGAVPAQAVNDRTTTIALTALAATLLT